MAVETYTYTAQQVATEVIGKLGDIGQAQVQNPMLISWINNGQRKMAGEAPFLEKTAATAKISGQAAYDLSAIATQIQDIDSVLVDGYPLEIIPYSRFQPLQAELNLANANGIGPAQMGSIWGSTLYVYPVPSANTANAITINYHAFPSDVVNIADKLTVPDRFYNGLVQYVFAQALLLVENFPAAKEILIEHEQSLQRQQFKNNGSPTEFYTGVTLDPYDDDAVY